MITLSDPETLSHPTLAIRYVVELGTVGAEFEFNCYQAFSLTPKISQTVDLSLVKPALGAEQDAIASFLAAKGCLQGYEIVRFWTPADCNCF